MLAILPTTSVNITCLRVSLVKKRRRKHAVLDTNLHQLGRITINLGKIDAVLPDPRLEFFVRGYFWLVTFFEKSLAKSDIRLYIAARSDGQARDSEGLLWLEVQDRSIRVVEENCWRAGF